MSQKVLKDIIRKIDSYIYIENIVDAPQIATKIIEDLLKRDDYKTLAEQNFLVDELTDSAWHLEELKSDDARIDSEYQRLISIFERLKTTKKTKIISS